MAQEAYNYYRNSGYAQVLEQPEVKKRKKTKAKTSGLTKLKKKIAYVGIFVMFFVVVFRFTVINELNRSNQLLQTQLNDIRAYNDQQTILLESKTNLKTVEQVAQSQLNMGAPDVYQTVEVDVEMANKAVKVENNKVKFGSSIKKIAETVMEYLY